jgi:hypothetical protein
MSKSAAIGGLLALEYAAVRPSTSTSDFPSTSLTTTSRRFNT